MGYLGYELKAQCGGNRVHRSAEPDAVMVFADRAVVFDHQARVTYLLALTDDEHEQATGDWLRRTAASLAELADRAPARTGAAEPGPLRALRADLAPARPAAVRRPVVGRAIRTGRQGTLAAGLSAG